VHSGRTQVYTGDGKGKTTAAFGLAMRAVGGGFKVGIVQFMKGRTTYGEIESAKKLGIDVFQYGTLDFVNPESPSSRDIEQAEQAFLKVEELLESPLYDIIIADEINVALGFGLLQTEQVLSLIAKRPDSKELILTGRYAKEEIIKAADLVTEMKAIKHYYNTEGLNARKGIEH